MRFNKIKNGKRTRGGLPEREARGEAAGRGGPQPKRGTFELGVAVEQWVSRNHARPPRVTRHFGPHQIADIVSQQLVLVSASTRTAGLFLSWNLKRNNTRHAPTPRSSLPRAGDRESLGPEVPDTRPLRREAPPCCFLMAAQPLPSANRWARVCTRQAQHHEGLFLHLFPCLVDGL